MTYSEREVLLGHLIARRPSITVLSEDLLCVICKCLCPQDRIAFLYALSRPQVRTANYERARRTTLYPTLRQYPILTATLCAERAAINLALYIHTMADRLLYELQPPVNLREKCPMILIACNWSAFKNKKLDSLAMVRWSHTPPHARVDVLEQITRLATVFNLSRYLPILSLAAYKTVSNAEDGMRVRVHNASMRVAVQPLRTEIYDLFSGQEDDARSLMQSSELRKTMWSRMINEV